MADLWLTVKQAARDLSVSDRTVRRWLDQTPSTSDTHPLQAGLLQETGQHAGDAVGAPESASS